MSNHSNPHLLKYLVPRPFKAGQTILAPDSREARQIAHFFATPKVRGTQNRIRILGNSVLC